MEVLVVDDDAAIRSLLIDVLTDEGWQVHAAESAEAAWPLARRLRPEIILLDQRLPGMTGAAFWQQLQADPATSGVPVILMSAQRDPAACAACRPAGYLRKPFTLMALFAAVAAALNPG